MWVYTRTCPAGSDVCGRTDYETDEAEWTSVLADPAGVTVNVDASLRVFIDFAQPILVERGTERGFLVFVENGIKYATSTHVQENCDGLAGGFCPAFSDSFASIAPGVLVQADSVAGTQTPVEFKILLGGPNSPRYFPGSVHYQNQDMAGDAYSCQFKATDGAAVWRIFSLPTPVRILAPSFPLPHISTSLLVWCWFKLCSS